MSKQGGSLDETFHPSKKEGSQNTTFLAVDDDSPDTGVSPNEERKERFVRGFIAKQTSQVMSMLVGVAYMTLSA